jgi:hypothetical protein
MLLRRVPRPCVRPESVGDYLEVVFNPAFSGRNVPVTFPLRPGRGPRPAPHSHPVRERSKSTRKLKLDEVEVESFETGAMDEEARGTVVANLRFTLQGQTVMCTYCGNLECGA